MTTPTSKRQSYDQLDAVLDFAYGNGARRQATRERNAAVASVLKKNPAAYDSTAETSQAA